MISFIIPVYNGEKYIERSVLSIINNTYSREYEIIIINDGSTDKTKTIVENLQLQYKEVKVYNQRNLGVSIARENGIRNSSGEWIVFVDADDYIFSDIGKIIDGTHAANCDWIVFSGNIYQSYICNLSRKDSKSKVIKAILNQDPGSELQIAKLNAVWSKAYKRTILEKYAIQFEKKLLHGEDMVFNLDYIKYCNKIYFCAEAVYMLCANENSATKKYQEKCVINDCEFFSQINRRKIVDQDEKLRNCYYKMALNGIWICIGQYFSHPNNPKNIFEKRKELARFVGQEPYKQALKHVSLEPDKRKRIIFMLLNLHCYSLVLKMVGKVKKNSKRKKLTETKI